MLCFQLTLVIGGMQRNPNINCTVFDTIKNAAGSNNFVLSVKNWIQRTEAKDIKAGAGQQNSKCE